jgi:hypothetical protein
MKMGAYDLKGSHFALRHLLHEQGLQLRVL